MSAPELSFVAIGLNESAHLGACLAALGEQGFPRENYQIVYVDSGSDDGSVAIARAAGIDALVEIPRATANAARARNAGLARAEAPFVHFVDGDTRLRSGWARDAMEALTADRKLAGVEGTLNEARPEHSLVHRTLQLDWPLQPGEVPFVGGNALYRTAAVRDAGGFDERLRLGEDPELGIRLQRSGWHFVRLERVMADHDLDARGMRAYLRQSYRKGLSCGLVVRATGGIARGYWRNRMLATLAWALGLVLLPALLIALLRVSPTLAASGLAIGGAGVSLLALRKAYAARRAGSGLGTSLFYGVHTYFSKIPAALGIFAAYRTRLPPTQARPRP